MFSSTPYMQCSKHNFIPNMMSTERGCFKEKEINLNSKHLLGGHFPFLKYCLVVTSSHIFYSFVLSLTPNYLLTEKVVKRIRRLLKEWRREVAPDLWYLYIYIYTTVYGVTFCKTTFLTIYYVSFYVSVSK